VHFAAGFDQHLVDMGCDHIIQKIRSLFGLGFGRSFTGLSVAQMVKGDRPPGM
jgi:hypothetical protein